MTYAKRNNLTIIGILLLLVIIGFFWYRSEAKGLEAIVEENTELQKQLSGDLEVTDTFTDFQVARDSLEKKLARSSKKLIYAREPTFSLSYINWLIETYNIPLDFDFYLNEKRTGKRYTTFVYTLNGEGSYQNICALIWYITHNPILYNIRDVDLKRSTKDRNLLNFTITLEGYSMSEAWESGDNLAMISTRLNWAAEFGYNAFANGYVAKPAPKPVKTKPVVRKRPKPPGLIDVEKASLIAIANNKVYLKSNETGKVVSLREGGRVYNGRLTRINQRMNRAEFQVNTTTGTRMIYLKLEYN